MDLLAFCILVFAAMITPGPNNLMIMHSGLNFGFKKSIRHMLGVHIGVAVLLFAIGLGLGYILHQYTAIRLMVKILGSFYMLYLAVKIAQMNENKTETDVKRPLSFTKAFILQFFNPKAWVVLITVSSMFHLVKDNVVNAAVLVCFVVSINIVCLFIWFMLGTFIEKIILSAKKRQLFNLFLGSLLAISVVMLWI